MVVWDLQLLLFFVLLTGGLLVAAIIHLYAGLRLRTHASLSPLDTLYPVWQVAPFGILSLDGDTKYCYANPYARRLLALPSSTGPLPNADWIEPLRHDIAILDAPTSQASITGRYRTFTLQNGDTIRWWIIPWVDVAIVFLLDVTSQRQSEASSRAVLNDLAHELRTPLATLRTHLTILQLDTIPVTTQHQSLDLLVAETARMTRLVEKTMELGRFYAGQGLDQRPIDLLQVVEEAIAQIHNELAACIDLMAETSLPTIVGDRDQLKQLFLNLLDNAIKHGHGNARKPVQVALHTEQTNGQIYGIRCTVCDTGPGIPLIHRPHLTRRFYRGVPSSVPGSGLGLALVVEILRRHGSQIEIESCTLDEINDGEQTGTRVCFTLPLVPWEGTAT